MISHLKNSNVKIAVVGLGYVGWPLFVLLSRKYECLGLDIDQDRLHKLKEGATTDTTKSVLTNDYQDLRACNIFIVCVPTGVDENNKPDLTPLKNVCKSLGEIIGCGSTVIFESTVFPGATEDVCIPILEKYSSLKVNKDFSVGYSPERINVGDHQHSLGNIPKVISATNDKTLELLSTIYSSIIDAPIIKASSIKVAEAAKMYENTQRDVLIALANEYSSYCKTEGIDIEEVTQCAASKWNFSRVNPGLVGGHCIGVDPYYLLDRARQYNLSLPLIKCARTINELIPLQVSQQIVQNIYDIKNVRILLLGIAYKPNTGDVRNSKVLDIYREIQKFCANVFLYDPLVSKEDLPRDCCTNFLHKEPVGTVWDYVINMVDHEIFTTLINDIKTKHLLTLKDLL